MSHAQISVKADAVPNLEALRWHNRVLLIFAASESEPKLKHQREAIAANVNGCQERDLKTFVVSGSAPEALALRTSLGVDGSEFAVLLVGKDGTVKLRSREIVTTAALFRLIDGMPMRREEMRGK